LNIISRNNRPATEVIFINPDVVEYDNCGKTNAMRKNLTGFAGLHFDHENLAATVLKSRLNSSNLVQRIAVVKRMHINWDISYIEFSSDLPTNPLSQ